MKKVILSIVVLILGMISSCEKKKNETENKTSTERVETINNSAENNKKLVLDFYQKLFGDKDLSAIDKYVAEDYIQHNPTVADGAEALKKEAEIWFKGQGKTSIDVQHAAAEGDLVFLHIKNSNPDGTLTSTIDIFKVINGKIVEHWDVHQNVPKESKNKHPMF